MNNLENLQKYLNRYWKLAQYWYVIQSEKYQSKLKNLKTETNIKKETRFHSIRISPKTLELLTRSPWKLLSITQIPLHISPKSKRRLTKTLQSAYDITGRHIQKYRATGLQYMTACNIIWSFTTTIWHKNPNQTKPSNNQQENPASPRQEPTRQKT